jgi:hypothetical protein
MADPDAQDRLGQAVRMLQLITVAMVMGVVTFLMVAMVLRATGTAAMPKEGAQPVVTFVAVIMAVVMLVAQSIVPGLMVKAGRQKLAQARPGPGDDGADAMSKPNGEAQELIRIFASMTIVGIAMIEAPALLAVVAFMIEGKQLALLLAVGLVIILGYRIPTKIRAADWMDLQRRQLEQERLSQR